MGFKGITMNTAAEDTAHIYAQDDAAIYQSIFGGDGVLNLGSLFAATVISNNKVRVKDGILCIGGHIGRTEHADYEDLTIENGTTGKYRNDIIYASFMTSGDVDTFKLAVRKGTAGSSAKDPAFTQGNLYQGDATREYPLWRVKLEGLNIVAVEKMFTVIPTIPELQEQIAVVNSNLLNLHTCSSTENNTIEEAVAIWCDENKPSSGEVTNINGYFNSKPGYINIQAARLDSNGTLRNGILQVNASKNLYTCYRSSGQNAVLTRMVREDEIKWVSLGSAIGTTEFEIDFSKYSEIRLIICTLSNGGTLRHMATGISSAQFLNLYGLDDVPLYWGVSGNHITDDYNLAVTVKVTKNKLQLYTFTSNKTELKQHATMLVYAK